ncbi:hypothetical protein BH789_gp092 [Gordonia phage GMA6]|uniref:Uncharacterized protein n=1 Tax=Gordonia phage GMA6 TaxID=1647285 RepID=A0A0K0NLB0_9CAUD|nr:hypothetical protein BH789_gp092 [Gordonia phage GMA6]AKL88373.1 hypothetical protein GMA6_92 [Gordonia phage GMA6]
MIMTLQDFVHVLIFIVMLLLGAALLCALGTCIYVARLRWPETKRNNKMGESAKSDVRLMAVCSVIFAFALGVVVWLLGQAVQDWGVFGWA